MNVNQFIAVGHVTKDPEVRTIKEGKKDESKVASFRLAINRSFRKGEEWVEKATFIDCEAWNRQADYVGSKVQKGTEVYVRGRLETDEWEKDGQPRSKNKIYVLEVQAGKNRKEGGGEEAELELPF